MKRIFALLTTAFAIVLFSGAAYAQEKPSKEVEKKVIIIKKQGDVPGMEIKADTIIFEDNNNSNDIAAMELAPRIVRGFRLDNPYPYFFGRTFLGVSTKENKKGAEVVDVTKKSPAEKAGIEKGDIITKVGDKVINNPQELSEAIRSYKPDDKVDITVLRGNKTKKLTAELLKWNDITAIIRDSLFSQNYDHLNDLSFSYPRQFNYKNSVPGFYFRSMKRSPSIGLQVQDTEDESGVKVLKVTPNGAAEKAGVKVGDIITAINDDKVTDVNSTLDEMRKADNDEYTLAITRDGKPLSIKVKIPKVLKKAEL